jgi:hypothetical protein
MSNIGVLVLHASRLLHELGLAAPIAFHLHKVELGFPTPRKRRCFPLAPRNALDWSDVGTRQLKSRFVVQSHRQRWAFYLVGFTVWGLYPTPAPIPSTILRVSSLMMMGPSEVTIRRSQAQRHIDNGLFDTSGCRSNVHLSHSENRSAAGIPACVHAPKSAPSPHYRQPRPRGADVYSIITHHADLAGAAITHVRYSRRVEAGRNLSQARIFSPLHLNALASQTGCPFRQPSLYRKANSPSFVGKKEGPFRNTLCGERQ